MTAVLYIDDRAVTVEIADPAGEVWSYALAPAESLLLEDWTVLEWALLLTRLDSQNAYRVGVDSRGKWYCECPDSRYRGRMRRHGCKHIQSIRPLKRLIDSLVSVGIGEGAET